MIGDASDLTRDFVRRENEIDEAGANCAAWHSVELCALFSLRERQTAGRFDRTQTGGPVAAGPRQHDTDCTRPIFLGERFKKVVDREIESLRSADQGKRTVLCDHALVWRLHVNRIRFRVRRSCYFADWHRGCLAEQIGKAARMMRIEMLHNHKR